MMDEPEKPSQDLWVVCALNGTHMSISLHQDVPSRGYHPAVYSVRGAPDVIERNYAELLAVVRLAKSEERFGGALIKAKLDYATVRALAPTLDKELKRIEGGWRHV